MRFNRVPAFLYEYACLFVASIRYGHVVSTPGLVHVYQQEARVISDTSVINFLLAYHPSRHISVSCLQMYLNRQTRIYILPRYFRYHCGDVNSWLRITCSVRYQWNTSQERLFFSATHLPQRWKKNPTISCGACVQLLRGWGVGILAKVARRTCGLYWHCADETNKRSHAIVTQICHTNMIVTKHDSKKYDSHTYDIYIYVALHHV